MSQRRMFSPQIVCSQEFLEMPVSARELYFQLGMKADDDGFIQPKMIMRMVGSSDDDLKILLSKRFLIPFESGVVVIKHWLIHNLIQKDRYHPTRFQEEKKRLVIKENKSYTDNVNKMLPEVRLGKVRIDKESALPNWLNKEAWEEWVAYRKERGKKLTPMSIKKQLKDLEKNKADQVEIINNSIRNGWTGLFALKKTAPHLLKYNPIAEREAKRKIYEGMDEDKIRELDEKSREIAKKFKMK